MALDPSIFTTLGIYNGPWLRQVTNPLLGNGTAGNDDILITNPVAGLVVNGDAGNDRITVQGGSSSLITTVNGGDGSDQLYGGTGINVLSGGAGNDYIDAGLGTDDVLSGGAGIDTLSFQSLKGSPVIIDMSHPNALGDLNVMVINGQGQRVSNGDVVSNDFENLVGTNFNDTLTGNAGDNVIYGMDGDDIIYGGGGNDTLVAGNGGGGLFGGDGNDDLVLGHLTPPTTNTSLVIDGGTGTNTLDLSGFENVNVDLATGHGQVGDIPDPTLMSISNVQNVIGSVYADVIQGDANNNVITGGGSFDDLTGGGGADTFKYNAISDSNYQTGTDTIEDFSEAQGDKIDLSAIDANANVAGDQAFTFIGTAAFDGRPGELRDNGQFLEGETTGGTTANFAIEFANGAPHNARDFIL
jgi:Ca2+-binding RTX toxin-like protein